MKEYLKSLSKDIINDTENKVSAIYIREVTNKEDIYTLANYIKATGIEVKVLYIHGTYIIRKVSNIGRILSPEERVLFGAPIEYAVSTVGCDYGVFQNGDLIKGLVFSAERRAERVCDILIEDCKG